MINKDYRISANEIYRTRDWLELTQEKFAQKLGVSISTVNRWENAVCRPEGLSLVALNSELDKMVRHKGRVSNQVMAAIKKGTLIKKDNCENCNSTKNVIAHHNDYSKPLDVIWLCDKCHIALHKSLRNGTHKSDTIGKERNITWR